MIHVKGFILLVCVMTAGLSGCSSNQTKQQGPHASAIPWIDDQWEAATWRAKSENRPLLVYFHAPWCIYCNIVNATCLTEPKVTELSRQFIPVRLDIDRVQNRALQEQFGILGVPTIVILDPNLNEIARVSDPNTEEMSAVLSQAAEASTQGPQEKTFFRAVRAELTDQTEEAHSSYQGILEDFLASPDWKLARVLQFEISYFLEKEDSVKAKSLVEMFLEKFPNHPWRPFAWEAYAKAQEYDFARNFYYRKALREVEEALKKWVKKDPNYAGQEIFYWELWASLQEKLSIMGPREAKAVIAKKAEKKAKKLKEDFLAKPYLMRAILWYSDSGAWRKSLRLVKKGIDAFPHDSTFYDLAAGTLKDAKRYPQAIRKLKEALQYTEGSRALRKEISIAELHALDGNRREAERILGDLLKRYEVETLKTLREEKYLKSAQKMLTELAQIKSF